MTMLKSSNRFEEDTEPKKRILVNQGGIKLMKILIRTDTLDGLSTVLGLFDESKNDETIIQEYEIKLNKKNKLKHVNYKIRFNKENNNWDVIDCFPMENGTVREINYYYLEFKEVVLNEFTSF